MRGDRENFTRMQLTRFQPNKVCGFYVDTMKALLPKQNPLYGRMDLTICLEPLETVMSTLRGLRKQKNSSSICIGCSFLLLGAKEVLFFLCSVEHYSIIKLVFCISLKV